MSVAGKWSGMVALVLLVASGCRSTRVERLDLDETRDLSGRWNDTDSRLVSEEMTRQLSQSPWVERFQREHERQPVVIIGTVRNLSTEHIALDTFVKDIERNLVNAGRVRLVARSDERIDIREERLDQQSYSTDESARRLAAETGADLMIMGSLKTQIDAVQGRRVTFYQVDLELINVENNEKVWIGSKKIRKYVRQSRATW